MLALDHWVVGQSAPVLGFRDVRSPCIVMQCSSLAVFLGRSKQWVWTTFAQHSGPWLRPLSTAEPFPEPFRGPRCGAEPWAPYLGAFPRRQVARAEDSLRGEKAGAPAR